MAIDWAAKAAWSERASGWGPVVRYEGTRPVPSVVFTPDTRPDTWRSVAARWYSLCVRPGQRPPSGLLDVLLPLDDGVCIRYAAIDWQVSRAPHELATAASVVTWGIQACEVFRWVASCSYDENLWLLTRPFALIDVLGNLRIGFLPPPVDAAPRRPEAPEPLLGGVVGALLDALAPAQLEGATGELVARLRARRAAKRMTLTDIELDLVRSRLSRAPTGAQVESRQHAEEGLGWIEVGDWLRASEHFAIAVRRWPSVLARWGHERCCEHLGVPLDSVETSSAPVAAHASSERGRFEPGLEWSVVEPRGLELEQERRFGDAIGLYERVKLRHATAADVHAARARCYLALGNTSAAIDSARAALATDTSLIRPRYVLVRALLASGHSNLALREAEPLLTLDRDSAEAHHLVGRARLAVGRHEDARAAFDRALALDPAHEGALLMRREAERTLALLGTSVGRQQVTVTVPASLDDMRAALLGGDDDAAIAELSDPRHDDNPDAQLVLARLLRAAGELERAQRIYERLTALRDPHRHDALVGKATLFLELGRLESALALFERLCAERADDLDAIEGRARTLERLGRLGEAAAELRRFIALASAGSDLRVRAAQLWLEQHAL